MSNSKPITTTTTKKPDSSHLLPFGVSLIAAPIWLFILVPSTIALKLLTNLYDYFFLPKVSKPVWKPVQAVPEKERNIERKYDLVLYGATGFTGRIAAEYLAKTYGNKIRWALAGRRRDALEAIVNDLKKNNPQLEVPFIICDAFKPETMTSMVSSTKVVATTVGPFDRYGTPLVELCAQWGTHYCDITGETSWVREMIDKYHELAKETGARIVHFTGHDCLPWDLMVLAVSDKFKETGDVLESISIYDEFKGEPSGGTIETITNSLTMKSRDKYQSRVNYDPLLKDDNGQKSEFNTKDANTKAMFYSKDVNAWCGFWLMTPVMITCVKRSNALIGYNKQLVYSQAQIYSGFKHGFHTLITMFVFLTCMLNAPLRWLLRKTVLPNPGEGPSEEKLKRGFLKITAFGTSKQGKKVKAVMFFPKDAGYIETARMLIESGLTLALDDDKLKSKGGIHTPATGLGYPVLERLKVGGTTFNFID